MLIIKKVKLSQAFTLIELITVMVIITILAGLLVGAGSAARRRASKTKAESMIASLEIAIGMYRDDTGTYPPAGYDGGCSELYPHLTSTSYGNPALPIYIPGWDGPYMEFDSDDLMQRSMPVGTATTIKDPWGNEYKYDEGPAWGNANSYNLWSCGPDGVDDSSDGNTIYGDDIYNW